MIRRHIEAEARVSYPVKRWHVYVASALPLAYYYHSVLGDG
ncbi:MAG: hypothetical protein VCE91_15415 [Nitrospinota bacterium]